MTDDLILEYFNDYDINTYLIKENTTNYDGVIVELTDKINFIEINEINNIKRRNDLLLDFNPKEKEAILRGKNNVIINSEDELIKYIKETFSDNLSRKNLYLGVIPEWVISKILCEISDISNERKNEIFNQKKKYDLVINQEEIRHLKKDSISLYDIISFINNLKEIICNFDTVRYTLYNKNQNCLRFKKTLFGCTIVSVEIVSNQKGTLRTQTIFFDKNDYKKKKHSSTIDK